MTSEQASLKKRTGHAREEKFAGMIDGIVRRDRPQGKLDVVDRQKNCHSVKGGNWWQIFLYSRGRLVENTDFQELGNMTQHMIACIDAFPEDREDYLKNKHLYKTRLQEPMNGLAQELLREEIFQKFLEKSFFNSGEVHYLSALRKANNRFYIFWHQDVVDILKNNLVVVNSKARNEHQYDCQKVLLKYVTNVSEIEIRTDSKMHYKQIKCRFNAEKTIRLLTEKIPTFDKKYNLYLYGKAAGYFKI